MLYILFKFPWPLTCKLRILCVYAQTSSNCAVLRALLNLKRASLVLLRRCQQDCTASSTGRCWLHCPAVPFMVNGALQGVLLRTLRWQQPKSSLWSKTTRLKYREVIFLPCTHKMTITPVPLHVSVKTGIPAREMPVWYLFPKSERVSPFQTCMNTSVQD